MTKEAMSEARVYSNYVIGIMSIVFSLITSWGIGGIIFGIIGLVRVKKDKGELAKKAKRLNMIGLILGILIIVASIIITVSGINWDVPTA